MMGEQNPQASKRKKTLSEYFEVESIEISLHFLYTEKKYLWNQLSLLNCE